MCWAEVKILLDYFIGDVDYTFLFGILMERVSNWVDWLFSPSLATANVLCRCMFRRDNEKRCRDISLFMLKQRLLFTGFMCFLVSLSMKTLRITLGSSSPIFPFFSQVEEGMMASCQVRPAEWMLTKRWDLCWIWSDPNFHNQNCGYDDVWLMRFPSWKCSFQETVGNMWKTPRFFGWIWISPFQTWGSTAQPTCFGI